MSDLPSGFVDYFSAEILVQTDYFSGEIETSEGHFDDARNAQQHLLRVRFGFRTLRSGDLALAVIVPDLLEASADERAKWSGFHLGEDSLSPEPDLRFDMWVKRYIQGSWDVENGVVRQIKDEIRVLNALTSGTVGAALYKTEDLPTFCFPTAQNNHRYHDAHSEAYKLLIDGLNKDALARLGSKLGIALTNPGSERTLRVLEQLLPDELGMPVLGAFGVVSENRRLADHQKRPAAASMDAFGQFNTDMLKMLEALRLIREEFSRRLNISVESAVQRHEALTSGFYPQFDEQLKIEPNYSICSFSKIEGKTIERVEYGWRKRHPDVHDSELAILHFTDGSRLAIHMASNIGNLTSACESLVPSDLRVSFFLNYVPALTPGDVPAHVRAPERQGKEG